MFLSVFLISSSLCYAADNVLSNPGFESGSGTGESSSMDNWTKFGNDISSSCPAPNTYISSERSASGQQQSGSAALLITSHCGPPSSATTAGVYQDIDSSHFSRGDTVTLQASAKMTSGDAAGELHIKIEFIGTTSVVESSDFATTSSFSTTSIQGTVPAGTTSVRGTIAYVMNTSTTSNDYFIDDVVMTIDPTGSAINACSFPVNSSFEQTGSSGELIMPGWTRFPFQSSLVNQKDNSTLHHAALDGTRALEMNIFGGQFTGVFQVVTGIRAGDTIDFSIYARTDNTSFGAFGILKIEFKDVNDDLISDTLSDKITKDNASGEYHSFSIAAVAPEETSYAVLVIVGDAGLGGGGDLVFDVACSSFSPSFRIYGDVFDATNGQLIPKTQVQFLRPNGTVIGTDTDNPYEFFTEPNASRMLSVVAEGYTFPSRINSKSIVKGDHGEIFNYASDTQISLPMDPGYPLVLKKDVNKKEASRGDLLVYTLHVKNNSSLPLNNVNLIDDLPAVFRYREGTAMKNGQEMDDPTQNSPLTFHLGTVEGSEEFTISYVAVVGTRAELGREYATTAVAKESELGWQLSNTSTSGPTVTYDPIFDLGTLIGKVFDDKNQNGIQDRGERGIPDVRLATEEGTVVYTDRHGKYHIPGVKPGRHLIKIDRHSLPPNTQFVTEEFYLVKITEGLLAKVNFAVQLPPDAQISSEHGNLEVHVTQQYDKFVPRLDVFLNQEKLEVVAHEFTTPLYFYMDGNYLDAVTTWKILIRDDRDQVIKTLGVTGATAVPPRIEWDGKDENGNTVEPERTYSYQLVITDGVHEDWTLRKNFKVVSKKGEIHQVRRVPFVQLEDNERPHQSIPVANKNSVMVRGHAEPDTPVKVNGHEVYVHEDGTFEKEVLLPPGVQVVKISNTDPHGKTLTYVREVNVEEDYFFMAAMGEGELGIRDVDSHLEGITGDDNFDDGFYEDGRLSYYLKAKIKGQYLITSSLDTDRTNKDKLFTNIDPDKYYPIYGDSSQINYEATDTKNNFFLLFELDKNYFKWGSFETGFTDLELAHYNRTLSGAKVHLEREKVTKYGEPASEITAFYAGSETAPDHNEFLGTGGSLYYLKNQNAVEGSEKVKIVYRDKISGRILSSSDLIEGVDYEIDYRQGRMILTKPLSSVGSPSTLISSDILDGNLAFLVIDYEFHPSSPLENSTRGIRARNQILENLKIGGTYVEEDREGPDYKLLGADAIFKWGRTTRLTAEYAQSRADQSTTNLSTDGGITFSKQDPVFFSTLTGNAGDINITMEDLEHMDSEDFSNKQLDAQDAYGLKFQTSLWNRLSVQSYYTYIENGFSNTSTLFQSGTQKIGGALTYRIAENTFFNLKHDTQLLIDEEEKTIGLYDPAVYGGFDLVSAAFTEGEENHTTTAQITHDIDKWGLIGEYRHQEINHPLNNDDPLSDFFVLNEESDDTIAGRATYHWSGNFAPFVEQQVTVSGRDNHQTTVGADVRVHEKVWVQGQETVGTRGNSTLLGLQAQTSETTDIYVNQLLGYDESVGHAARTTYGTRTQLDEKSSFNTERQYTTYRKGQLESNLFGYESKLKKGWSLGGHYERIDSDNDFARDAVSGTLGYTKWNQFNLFSKLEVRQDETGSSSTQRQYFTQNLAKWQTTQNLELLGRFNYGFTEERVSDNDLAEFFEAGTGFAYRPVAWDRLNFLGKYTYLSDDSPDDQSDLGINILEHSHLASIEGAYDISRWFQIVEKYAFKMGEVSVDGSDFGDVKTHLWINRLNFHVTRKWDIAGEYRLRKEMETNDRKSGLLIEVDREMIDYVRLGMGYNFTDFSDDLRTGADDDAHGFFIRLTGKY